jgi:hypothetical protein
MTKGFNPHSSTSGFLFLMIYHVRGDDDHLGDRVVPEQPLDEDGHYGFGYASPARLAYAIVRPDSATAAVLVVMVPLHGCRLGSYLAARWRRYVPKYRGGLAVEALPRLLVEQLLLGDGAAGGDHRADQAPAVVGVLETRHADGPLG